jgi:ribosomal protein S18 acetylase RimI-like enzyme
MNVAYRKARPADAESIVQFQINMALETEQVQLDRATCLAGVRAVFVRPEMGSYYVATDGDRVIASLLITYEWSDWRNRTVWWIQSVYVHRDYRRQGIYAGLYRHIQGLAATDPAVGGIRLYVDKRNAPAQKVYSNLGMNGEHYLVYEWMKRTEG